MTNTLLTDHVRNVLDRLFAAASHDDEAPRWTKPGGSWEFATAQERADALQAEKTHLTLKLLVQISLRSRSGVRTREALRNEIVRQRGDPVAQLLRRGAYVRSEICLMELMPAFRRRCDESNPKTASQFRKRFVRLEALLF
jgi:hypothetical protein